MIEFVGFAVDGAAVAAPIHSFCLRDVDQAACSLEGYIRPSDIVIQPAGAAYDVARYQLVKIYFEPAETVRVRLWYKSTDTASNTRVSLQGYYVDIP